MAKIIKGVGKVVGGVLGGAANVIKGAANVVAGVVTFDGEKIAQGAAGMFLGASQVVTLGLINTDNLQEIPPVIEEMEGRKVMARGAETPRQITYGKSRVGGQLVFFESTGTDSQFMHMIVVVAPHLIEAIDEVYFNDDLAFNANGTATAQFSGKATITKVLGNQTGAIQSIVDAVPSWTTDHKLMGCAYIYVRLSYDKDVFSRGMPNISAVVRGKKVFNPATGLTQYTRNHALICLDYLQSELGFRATADEIDTNSFIAGAAICDQQVAAATGTEARYTVDGTISLADSPIDNLESLVRAGAAISNYVQGKFTYVAGAYQAPVMSFNEDDLAGGINIVAGQSKSQLINTAKGTYIDSRQNFEPIAFPPIAPSGYLALDGEELLADMPMKFAHSPTLARRLAKITVEATRYGVAVSVRLKWRALQLTVGDRITLSIARFGWVNKVFRVNSVTVGLGAGVSLTLREDAPAVWGWAQGDAIDVTPPPTLNLPPREPIAAPTGLVIKELVNTPATANANRSTLVATATAPSDSRFSHIRFERRVVGTDEWQAASFEGNLESGFIVDSNGLQHEIRAQSVSINGVVSPLQVADTFTVSNIGLGTAGSDGGLFNPPPRVTVPPIKRLELVNRITNDDWDKFKSPNAEFRWAKLSTTQGGSIIQLNGALDLHLEGYRVRISKDGKILREEIVKDSFYTYTYDKNKKDNGTPVRSFRIDVMAVTTTGYVSASNGFEVENPAPLAVTNATIEPNRDSVVITYTRPSDFDFVGVRVGGKVYSDTTITLPPLTQRSVDFTVTSVDEFGDGGSVVLNAVNPAPNAPTQISVETSFTTATLRFIADQNDYDVIGVNARYREVGGAWSAVRFIESNQVTFENLPQNTDFEFGLASVDTIGAGSETTILASTKDLQAADVTGLGDWATLTDPADLAFIQANVANDAIESDKIGSLVAGKITTGQIDVTVDVGTGVRLNGANGYVQTLNNGYKTTLGAHTINGQTYVLSAADGNNVNFYVDASGNGKFGQLALGANGSISAPEFELNNDGSARLGLFSVGSNGDISSPNLSVTSSGAEVIGLIKSSDGLSSNGKRVEIDPSVNRVNIYNDNISGTGRLVGFLGGGEYTSGLGALLNIENDGDALYGARFYASQDWSALLVDGTSLFTNQGTIATPLVVVSAESNQQGLAITNSGNGNALSASVTGTGTNRAVLATAQNNDGAVFGSFGAGKHGVSAYGGSGGFAFYSISGGYGPFTGSHDGLILHDEVVSTGDILCSRSILEAAGDISDVLMIVSPSTNPMQKSAVGIFTGYREIDDSFASLRGSGKNEINQIKSDFAGLKMNSLGEGRVNVCGEGGNIEAGDFICTSSTHGKGMKYDGLDMRLVVAKAVESCDFGSESEVKLIGCIYLCG